MAQINPIAKELIVKITIYIVVAALIYFMIIRPVLIRFGVIKSADQKKQEEQNKELGTSTGSPFSPTYYKKIPKAVLITRANAERLADIINNAIGFFSDDVNEVIGVLRQIKYKTQLSFIADVMFQKHKYDLFTLLNRNLSKKEMETVTGIANNLL